MATANIANTKVVPSETTLTPYYDDFDESKNFHRILFRPGYAVQARELTQLQTILQNQIERFGNHIFKNGSLVLGGQISLDTTAKYINLQTSYAGSDIVATNFTGNNITYSSGNAKVRAVVLAAREALSPAPPTLVVKYLTGDEFDASTTIKSDANVYANVAVSAQTGFSTVASIADGIFFINGFFVKVPSQLVIVDKYSTQANGKVGLEYTTDIVDETGDTSLLDPAQEASNYQAPGATRLRVNFDLAVRSLDSVDDETFVEMLRVENGVIKKQIKYPIYSELGDTLARRTFDESGNYTVRRFKLNMLDDTSNANNVIVALDPGKAYIKGYEYESIAQENLTIPKARTTDSVTNKDISIVHGNYFFVQNTRGYFDTSSMERVDIHAVPFTSINLAATTGYTSTKVASARVRARSFYSASNTADANSFISTLSLFDIKYANLTTYAATSLANVSANGLQIFSDPSAKFTSNNNAYVGATVRVISGTGLNEQHTISAYNGATKTLNIADTFIIQPTATSNISIDFNVKSAESIIKHTTFTGSATNANTNISPQSFIGTDAFLSDTNYNTLIYPFADRWIKEASITGQDYTYMGIFSGTFSSNTVTISITAAQEQFVGTSDTTGKSLATLTNFAAFRSTGERINLSAVTVDNGTGAAVLTNSDNYNGATYVYYNVKKIGGNDVKQKTKTLYTGNTSFFAPTGSADATIAETTSAGTTTFTIYGNHGQVLIQNPSKRPLERMSLYISDVWRIQKIYDAGTSTPTAGASMSGYTDVTTRFGFDNGQRDSHYDHANIYLNERNSAPSGNNLVVVFDWLKHDAQPGGGDGKGYFSVDSYASSTTYSGIPTYTATDGSVYSLRDSIDFRPSRANFSNTSPSYTLNGVRIPNSGTGWQGDYQYYLGRRDLVTLTTDFSAPFKVIQGIPDKNPVEPRAHDNSMILYKLYLEPYTLSTSNVGVRFVENKRYTMRDIGKLETRIQNLEYYQTLSILEQQTNNMKILGADGLERTKYGILADDFTTHGYGAVDNEDYLIAVDRVIGGLTPAQNTQVLSLANVASNTSVKTLGPSTTLAFTEETFITQNLATKFVPVQPYMLAQWVGAITMSPPDDIWTDTATAPDVVVNLGENNALLAANNVITNSNQRSTRARRIRANNALVTETSWWNTFFGSSGSEQSRR